MEYKYLRLDKKEGVGTITYTNEQNMNSIDAPTLAEMHHALDDMLADPEVMALVVTGSDRVFAAGADITYLANADALEMEDFIANAHALNDKLANSPKPVVAAIAGPALGGGCELPLACDIRIAADNAIFGLPEVNLGIFPGGGGTQRLVRIVGWGWARQLLLTGEIIDAQKALTIGMVTQVVPVAELQETAFKQARSLGRKSPRAIQSIKQCLMVSENADQKSALLYEQKKWALLFAGNDQTEGMKAFLESRRPVFTGK